MVKIWKFELLKLKLKNILSYKESLVGNIFDYSILIVISYYVWTAFHPSENVIAYVFLTIAMMSFSYYEVISYLFQSYRSGYIIFDLLRPVKLREVIFWNWLGEIIKKIIPIALFIIVIILNPNVYLIISMSLAVYIMFLIGFIAAMLTYDSLFEWGIGNLLRALAYFTGGGIPIFLMPEWLKKLLLFNPFFYAMAAPWVAAKNPNIILIQIALIGILFVISEFLEKKMISKFTTVGV